MEAVCVDKAMLPVASDAHTFLSIMFGMCSYHQDFLVDTDPSHDY